MGTLSTRTLAVIIACGAVLVGASFLLLRASRDAHLFNLVDGYRCYQEDDKSSKHEAHPSSWLFIGTDTPSQRVRDGTNSPVLCSLTGRSTGRP